MDNISDYIALIISFVALIFSIISWIITTKVSKGQLEIEIKNMISDKKKAFLEYVSKQDKEQVIDFLIEEELNAYEHACILYNENKIDKKSFKKTYFTEITNIIENEDFANIGKFSDVNCKYENLVNVYKEWIKK